MAAKYKVSQLNKTANDTASAVSASSILAYEVTIKNLSSEVCYIGDSSVSTSNGFALAQNEELKYGESHSWETDLKDVFIVTSANTADIRVSYVKRN